MRAVTFQAPGEVRVEERPDPELEGRSDALIRVEGTGVCGSDLHIYHGRVQIEPGFILGHEFVGTVIATGADVTTVSEGDRVLGTYSTACGECFFCARGDFHKCDNGRVFGHGATLGSLQGAQAELLLVPNADLTLRPVPDGLTDEVALFAGDVMGTGYHAVVETGHRAGRQHRGPGPRSRRPLRRAGRPARAAPRRSSPWTPSPSASTWRDHSGRPPCT